MSLTRWFTIETADRDDARGAFTAAVAAACTPVGLADLVPAAWTTIELLLDVPPERINPLLAPADALSAAEWVRVDLALVPLLVAGVVVAWGVNWLASVPGDPAREAVIAGLVLSYWTGQPATSRPVEPATLADFPDALASSCRDRVLDGVTVRLLDAAPLHPHCAFAGA